MTEYVHIPHHDVLSELTRERDELKTRCAHYAELEALNQALRDLLVKAATVGAYLTQQNAKLQQALKRYGEHSPDCAYADNLRGDCDCGFAEALDAALAVNK